MITEGIEVVTGSLGKYVRDEIRATHGGLNSKLAFRQLERPCPGRSSLALVFC
jgi:hypothetical protein